MALVVFGLFTLGVLLTFVSKNRANQDRVYCQNNLRIISQGVLEADLYLPPAAAAGVWAPALNLSIPAGTVPNPALPPEQRLSWIAPILPGFDQKRQDTLALEKALDLTLAWDAGPNHAVGQTTVLTLLCFANPATVGPDQPGVTQYVGAGGVGPDAASLKLTTDPLVPSKPPVAPPRAGCFRYDAKTPFVAIVDGTSNTILLGELSTDLGPWLQGGPSTVHTLDTVTGARPQIGAGGQFGGNHFQGANFAFADGSVRFLTERTNPKVLESLFTINGGTIDPVPGE
ncbi:hypothetical protein FRUB_07190 [Fimbriiglobus ruber]|uniref:DUF1559 domain-containing protein n=1 Tax=Fimbriiglobus ruber TaxID=1908690 RepID=A0A225D8Y3_9BACT|nr:hypothetical protein FRUB_07190 [Fimbriiglobus ruber]